jgi:hypothetical protein
MVDVVAMFVEKVGNIEERVAFQAQVDEGRLHAWQHARYAAFMDAPGKRILVGALEVHFHQLIVFEKRYTGFVPIGRNHQLLAHTTSCAAHLERRASRERKALSGPGQCGSSVYAAWVMRLPAGGYSRRSNFSDARTAEPKSCSSKIR